MVLAYSQRTMPVTGLRASTSGCAIKIVPRLRSTFHQVQANPSFGWPSPDAPLLRPPGFDAAGGAVWVAARLLRLLPRRFAPPAVQWFKHSRRRAGLTGTPAAFNSSTSCSLLQPLCCKASNRSRNGSNKSAAVFRFFGGSRCSQLFKFFIQRRVIQLRGDLFVINAFAHNFLSFLSWPMIRRLDFRAVVWLPDFPPAT